LNSVITNGWCGGWFPEQAEGWWEQWMRQADQVLDDDELLEAV
jgi:hypothetical protein